MMSNVWDVGGAERVGGGLRRDPIADFDGSLRGFRQLEWFRRGRPHSGSTTHLRFHRGLTDCHNEYRWWHINIYAIFTLTFISFIHFHINLLCEFFISTKSSTIKLCIFISSVLVSNHILCHCLDENLNLFVFLLYLLCLWYSYSSFCSLEICKNADTHVINEL